ncbi:IQ calmodulin-binding motif-containing protein [Legionella bononiensis]|uniref:IQ calmodulin-binding motif-containing protein n=1 Tax=Legionella bononiensis TaxID=2793102 RepID=A0ABS1W996_9GAMM|nr:IQ calmodulin-binding motif-containing protein [Legionella bononiensis]MBL7480898.1 IQ calmodulin-binding motif-containing protein [Legionella bononiensis]MBL7525920.1 IQ calmodulin-binding motif-containing protein [Legionella bononiensis]MBL7564013.1 IQ calmodulin-binding motif-containing protein [Legionella bononiensis]
MGRSKTDGLLLEEEAAVKIQTAYRGFFSRKSYAITQMPSQYMKPFKVMIKGNDPEITGLPHHTSEEHIALVAISGMRSVEIACQLSSGCPKLIIIDNSKYVVDFWRKARYLINHSDCEESFLGDLDRYIEMTQCNRSGLKSKEFDYLKQLFNRYGFEKLQLIIGGTTVIAQSWVDRDVMIKVKNILRFIEVDVIYAYPSNIVAYLRSEGERSNSNQVLDNIQSLNPALAIHTDLVSGKPKHVLKIEDHNPALVGEKLQLNSVQFSSSQMSLGRSETLLLMLFVSKLKGNPASSLSTSSGSFFRPELTQHASSATDLTSYASSSSYSSSSTDASGSSYACSSTEYCTELNPEKPSLL